MEYDRRGLRAEDIADDLLYRTGRALVDGNYDGIEDCFICPQTVETPEGVRVVRTPEDVRSLFERVREYFAKDGIVDVVRTIVEAKFVSETEIESIHASCTINAAGEQTQSPYPVFSLLRSGEDGAWRIAYSTYAIVDSRRHSQALLGWSSNE